MDDLPKYAWILILSFSLLQSTSPAQSSLQRRPTESAPYRLGEGDQITVHVIDLDDIPSTPLRIDPNGFVDLPLVGRVLASGKTVDEFKADLAARLAKYINAPQVSVNVTEDQSRPVSVVGSVGNPGVQQLQGPKRLLEVISASGGIRPEAGPDVVVTRRASEGGLSVPGVKAESNGEFTVIRLPLGDLLAGKTPSANLLVLPGDVVSIPKGDLVYVVGGVKKAGGFVMSTHTSMSVLQAVTLAEGIGPHAASRHGRILRPAPGGDGQARTIPVDVDSLLAGKAPDVPLFANDILVIPNSAGKQAAERALEALVGVGTGLVIYR